MRNLTRRAIPSTPRLRSVIWKGATSSWQRRGRNKAAPATMRLYDCRETRRAWRASSTTSWLRSLPRANRPRPTPSTSVERDRRRQPQANPRRSSGPLERPRPRSSTLRERTWTRTASSKRSSTATTSLHLQQLPLLPLCRPSPTKAWRRRRRPRRSRSSSFELCQLVYIHHSSSPLLSFHLFAIRKQ